MRGSWRPWLPPIVLYKKRIHESPTIQGYKCPDCGRTYPTVEAYDRHQQAIQQRQERLKRRFQSLQEEEDPPNNRTAYTCPICGSCESFIGTHALRIHMGRKHGIYSSKKNKKRLQEETFCIVA